MLPSVFRTLNSVMSSASRLRCHCPIWMRSHLNIFKFAMQLFAESWQQGFYSSLFRHWFLCDGRGQALFFLAIGMGQTLQ